MKKKIDIEVNPKVLDVEIERHTSGTRQIPGPKGEDGKTPTKEELLGLIIPNIPDPIPGKDGRDGVDGETPKIDYDRIISEFPREEEIIKKVVSKIPKPKNGKDGKDGKSLKFTDLTPYQIQTLTGSPGNPGEGVPRGGATGQKLIKASARNYHTEWADDTGGGSGDVTGPATNTADYIPQWDGADSKTLKNGIPTSTFAPALGADDNYVTDAEKIVIGNTSGTNSGDNATNTQYSGLAASKQDTLVSGTSIKTINSTSLLGSGDIVISGGTDEKVKYDAGDSTAGYVADKIVAGTGISVAEGTGANENKLVVTSTITQATRDSLGLDTDDTVAFANLSGTNTGDNAVNSNYSGLVSNATHAGEVTGSGELTLDKTAISNKADTVITASDVILFGDATDSGNLKSDTVQGILDLVPATPTRDSLGLDTDDSPQFAGINLGHASDTTLTRVSAGVVAVEGVNVVTVSATQTLTNKTLSGPTVQSGYVDLDLPASDHTATGMTTNAIASGYSASAFDLVFLGSGGKWLEVDSDAVATCKGLLGIALEAKNDTEAMLVALPGSFVRDDTWNWTVGATLYAGETLGAMQEAIPTGADAIIKVVGFAVSADVIFFNPSPDQQSTVA